MKVNKYMKKMDAAFEVAVGAAGKVGKRTGYIHGYLDGMIDGIIEVAIEDMEISELDYNVLIAYSSKLKEDFDEGKSI